MEREMIPVARQRILWIKLGCTSLLVVVMTTYAAPFGLKAFRSVQYGSEHEANRRLLHSLRGTPPTGIPVRDWEDTCGVVETGFVNACFSPTYASIDELRRLRIDVAAMINDKPPSFDLLRAIWLRFGECGPKAAEYVERFRPFLEDSIQNAVEPKRDGKGVKEMNNARELIFESPGMHPEYSCDLGHA